MAFSSYNNNNWSASTMPLTSIQSGSTLSSFQLENPLPICMVPMTHMQSNSSLSSGMSFEGMSFEHIPDLPLPTFEKRTSTLDVTTVENHFGCSIAGEWQDFGDKEILHISGRKIVGFNKVGFFVMGPAAPCINLDGMTYNIMFTGEKNTMVLCCQFTSVPLRTLNRLSSYSEDKVNTPALTPVCRVPVSNTLTPNYNSYESINYDRRSCSVGSYSSFEGSFERKCSVGSDSSTGMSRREQIQICSRNVANLLAQNGNVFNQNPNYFGRVQKVQEILRSSESTDEERDWAVQEIYDISQWKVKKENGEILISNALLDPTGYTCGRIQAKTQTSLVHCYGFLLLCQAEGICFSEFNMCPAKGKKKSNLKGFHVSFRCTADDMKKMVLLQDRIAPKTEGRSYAGVVSVKIDNQGRFPGSDKNWVPIVEAEFKW